MILEITQKPNGIYHLICDDEIIARSCRKSKLEALIYATNEGIITIEDVKSHRYLEWEIMEIEKKIRYI